MRCSTNRLYQLIVDLQVPTNKQTVLLFFNNPRVILEQLISFSSPQPSQISKVLAHANQLKNTIPLKRLVGTLALRLIFIDVPESNIVQRIKRKERKSPVLMMIQALSYELLSSDSNSKLESDSSEILTVLNLIEQRLQSYQSSESGDPFKVKLQSNFQYNRFSYSCLLNKSKLKEQSCEAQTLYQELVKSEGHHVVLQLWPMFEKIHKSLAKVINQREVVLIIENTILTFGSILFFETLFNSEKLEKQQEQENGLADCRFNRHVCFRKFEIKLSIKQPENESVQVEIQISYNQGDLEFVGIAQFMKEQQALAQFLESNYRCGFQICIGNTVYCFDRTDTIGSGSFGTIFKAKALEVTSITHLPNKDYQIAFSLKKKAVKQLKGSTTSYQKQGFKVDRKRQLLILSLIRQVKYEEDLKKAQKAIGIETERQLVGIDYLITLQETFKVPSFKISEERFTFLIFEQFPFTIGSKKWLPNSSPSSKQFIIFQIYQKIFAGLHCLHCDINNLYHPLLKKYFQEQDKNEQNQAEAVLSNNQRCGIYHRDIKSSNIMISFQEPIQKNLKTIRVQIIDFGMAGIANFEKYRTNTNCGSTHYMAPEIKNRENYCEKIDIWSAGIALSEHLSQKQVNFTDSNIKMIPKYLAEMGGKVQQKKWLEIVGGCLSIDQQSRKSAAQMLKLFEKYQFQLYDIQKIFISFAEKSVKSIEIKCIDHAFEDVHMTVLSGHFQKNQKLTYNYSTFQKMIHNGLTTIQYKIMVLLAVTQVYLSGFSDEKITDFLGSIQILTCEQKKADQVFLIVRVKKSDLYQVNQPQQNTDLTVNNSAVILSDEFKWFQEDQLEEKSQKTITIILNCNKIFTFDSEVRELKSGYSFAKVDALKSQITCLKQVYSQSGGKLCLIADGLFASDPLSQFQVKKQLKIYWLQDTRIAAQQVQEKMKQLIKIIKTIRKMTSEKALLRITQFRKHLKDSNFRANKSLFQVASFQLFQRQGKQEEIYVQLYQQQIVHLLHILLQYPQVLFSVNFKLLTKDILLLFRPQTNYCMPYSYMYLLSLFRFSVSKQMFYKKLKDFQLFSSRGEYLLGELNVFVISLINIFNSQQLARYQANFLQAIIQKIQPIARILQKQLKEKFGTNKILTFELFNESKSEKCQFNYFLSLIQTVPNLKQADPGKWSSLANLIAKKNDLIFHLKMLSWLLSSNDQNS